MNRLDLQNLQYFVQLSTADNLALVQSLARFASANEPASTLDTEDLLHTSMQSHTMLCAVMQQHLLLRAQFAWSTVKGMRCMYLGFGQAGFT